MRYARIALPLLLAGTMSTNVMLLLRDPAPPALPSDRDVARSVSNAFRDVAGDAAKAVVGIRTNLQQGSGVMVDPLGLIVTNHHVIQGSWRIDVRLHDGRSVSGHLVGSDPDTDIALVSIEGEGYPSLELATDEEPAIGTWALAIGNPFGLEHSVTFGIISARDREAGLSGIVYEDFLQTDAAINAGNSGGALIDLDGRMVGIITAKELNRSGSQGLGFAIPANMVAEVFEELKANGHVERGWFGIIPDRRFPDGGVRIGRVTEDSPAKAAGLRERDVITGIDGTNVLSSKELFTAIAHLDPGSTVRVDIRRHGEPMSLDLLVGTRPLQQEVVAPPATRD